MIISLALTLMCLTSCNFTSFLPKPAGKDGIPENLIYNENSQLYLVYDSENVPESYVNKLIAPLVEIGIIYSDSSLDRAEII